MSSSIQGLGSNLAGLGQSRGRQTTELAQQFAVGTSNLTNQPGKTAGLASNLLGNKSLGHG
jgi:hypothetical protein